MFGTGVGFAEGMIGQQEKSTRQRMELAKAFEEFKANNPYATAQEFQAFIDQAAGMNNYLRGGLPGRDVLQQLEARGREAKQRAQAEDQLKQLKQRGEIMGMLDGLVEQSLIGMDGDDFDGAYSKFVESIGGEGVFAGMNLRDRFRRENRDRIASRNAMQYLPQVMPIIRAARGDVNATQLAQQLGIPGPLANSIATIAAEEYERERRTQVAQSEDAILQRAVRALGSGLDPAAVITEQSGIDLRPDEVKRITTEAQRVFQTQEEQRQVERENARSTQMVAAINYVTESLGPTIAMRTPGEAKEMIRQVLNGFPGAMGTLGGDDEAVDFIFNKIADTVDLRRREQYRESEQNIIKALPELRESTLERNAKIAEALGGKAAQEGWDNKGGVEAMQVYQWLGQRYDLNDPATADAIKRVMSSNEWTSMEEMQAAVEGDPGFKTAAISIKDQVERQRQLLSAQNPKPQLFSDWMRDWSTDVGSGLADIESAALDIAREGFPERRADQIKAAKQIADREYQQTIALIQAEMENKDAWLMAREGWDTRSVNQLLTQIKAHRDRLHGQLDAMLERHQQSLQQQQQPAQLPASPNAAPRPQQTPTPRAQQPMTEILRQSPAGSFLRDSARGPLTGPRSDNVAAPEEIPNYPQRQPFWPQ